MKILHMIRQNHDSYPMDIASAQKAAGDDVKVVLLHDAVLSCAGNASTFCCKEDAEARGVSCGNQVDYQGIVKMIFDADIVSNW
jgi:hypothetical protein